MLMLSPFSLVRLCDPLDHSPPDSSVHGMLQARIVEWVAVPSSRGKVKSEVAQLCPTLSDPMDYSLPGSSIHGIFQARVLSGLPLPSPMYILVILIRDKYGL